jgi:hypothetical protein
MSLVGDESSIIAIILRKVSSLYKYSEENEYRISIENKTMSKKFGTNTKSVEARARKDAVKQANERDKQLKLEDEYWRDDDKHIQKKQQRKVSIIEFRNLIQYYYILE